MPRTTGRHHQKTARALKTVALFEGAKGALVLVTGLGLLTLVHRNLHALAEELVRHLHLNPARHYPRVFLDAADKVNQTELWVLACGAVFYAAVRFIEATGLWLQRRWAEWFGFLSGGIYIPAELYEVLRGATWANCTVLAVNLIIVLYLLIVLIRTRR